MIEKKLPNFSKAAIVAVGSLVVAYGLIALRNQSLTVGFALLLGISAIIAPRMSLVIPRSKIVISFSDSVVFLSFLLYGPECAVIMAVVETLANCYYNKVSGRIKFAPHMITVNTFGAGLGTASACLLWQLCAAFTDLSSFLIDTWEFWL